MPYDYLCQAGPRSGPCTACQQVDSENIIRKVWPPTGTDEPNTVKALFFQTAVAEWKTYMAQWSPALAYGGVFVHQKPYCTFNDLSAAPVRIKKPRGTHRCELGDLLIIFTDAPARRRVAALFQAKMIGGAWPPRSTEGSQWTLYTEWPTFRYTLRGHTGAGNQTVRTLPFTGGPDPAAQYLELGARASGQKIACTEALPSATWIRWDQIINCILNGTAGRDFSWDQASAVNEWDKLIWDLITVTATCPMPGGSAGGVGAGAGGTAAGTPARGALLWLDALDQIAAPPDGRLPNEPVFEGGDDDEIHGISLLHFSRRHEERRD